MWKIIPQHIDLHRCGQKLDFGKFQQDWAAKRKRSKTFALRGLCYTYACHQLGYPMRGCLTPEVQHERIPPPAIPSVPAADTPAGDPDPSAEGCAQESMGKRTLHELAINEDEVRLNTENQLDKAHVFSDSNNHCNDQK